MKNQLTNKHYELIGMIALNLPDDTDEVACLKVSELFHDEAIYAHENGEWIFHTSEYLRLHPTEQDAEWFAKQILEIVRPEPKEIKTKTVAPKETLFQVFCTSSLMEDDCIVVTTDRGIERAIEIANAYLTEKYDDEPGNEPYNIQQVKQIDLICEDEEGGL
jgi:hypothetical protein